MDADGPSTATNSENGDDDEQSQVEPHFTTQNNDPNEVETNGASPSTPTRSRSPSSLSKRLSSTSLNSALPSQSESTDALSPLSSITQSSSSTYSRPARPFSLSSEPDTPTTPSHFSSLTHSTPSPKKPSTFPVSPSSSSTGVVGVPPGSPSLTQQVWRNSMGLPPSPVAPVGFPSSSSSATPRGLVDVNLSESSDDGRPPRISTKLDFASAPSAQTSPTSTFKSQAIEEAFAKVREESEAKAKEKGLEGGEEEEGEMVDWDFWGRVMSDYEEVARTQRASFCSELTHTRRRC